MTNALTFSQIKPLVLADLKSNITPALLGEPGIGKSSFLEALAAALDTKVFTLPVNQLADRSDLTGVRATQSKDGSWRQEAFPHATIMDCIEYARNTPNETPILFLDEFNRASSDITSSVLSFQTLRRIGTIDFPDNLLLVVAGNDKGNVTTLDKASISRFSLYHVRPDLETFLSVQSLNPFVHDVLMKNPNDLMAESVTTAGVVVQDDDDDNDDIAFDQLELMDDNSFEQITRPRTISYLSNWLNNMGIDKSGSQKEIDTLKELVMDMSTDNENNILFAGIKSKVGHTTFAVNLYNEIYSHFNRIISSSVTSAQPIFINYRPHQDVIKGINQATSAQDIEYIVNQMSDNKKQEAILWLFETANLKEINNNQAVELFIKNAAESITTPKPEFRQDIFRLYQAKQNIAQANINTFLNTNPSSGLASEAAFIRSLNDM